MSAIRKVITFLESPKMRQRWRAARLVIGIVGASGIVDQLANGTATRTGIVAVVVAVVEVVYHSKVKA